MDISLTTKLELYRKMVLTRYFEEKAAELFAQGRVHGTAHFCIGEEATGTGVGHALERDDYVLQTHRGHGQAIGMGMDTAKMMAEFLGKEAGYCRGRGGCMHIADFSRGSLGANGIVGGGLPLAVGAGWSQQFQQKRAITVCFFGDGAANQGSFHESLNLASVWNLPVLFVCTNNLYGMSTHIRDSMNITDIARRAEAYGMRGVTLDGNDVLQVYRETAACREYLLREGPLLLVLDTYRWMGHSKSDAQVYRSREEVAAWKQRDPIARLREHLLTVENVTEAVIEGIESSAGRQIAQALLYAEASPDPVPGRLAEEVFAP